MAGAEGEHDELWRRERLRLLVQSTAEIESRTLFANVIGTLLIVSATQWLPNASDFHLPMLLRFVAIFGTALLYEDIRKRLQADRRALVPLRFAVVMAGIGGVSWATLVIPLYLEPYLHPATYFVTAGVFVGAALIVANTSAIKRIAVSYSVGFAVTFLGGLAFAPLQTAVWLAGGLAFIALGIGIFSIGSARQRLEAADTLLENQRLSEELEEALARAEFFADHDPLTGLYNRRALFEHRIHRAAPGDRFHVLLIDLDNFKQVNDRFGHETGDRVLIGVAQVLRDFVRKTEGEGHVAARLGGEEFAVFLALEDPALVDRLAGTLHLDINRVAAGLGLPPKLGTASIGISPMKRGDGIANALHRADKALYEAKRGGRDRVCRDAA